MSKRRQEQDLTLTAAPHGPFPSAWLLAIITSVQLFDDNKMVRVTLAPQAGPRHAGHDFTLEMPTALTPGSLLQVLIANVLGITVRIGDKVDLNPLIGRSLRVRFSPADADGHQMLLEHKRISAPRTGEKGDADATLAE